MTAASTAERLPETSTPAPRRFVDKGAVFAGWVGFGMALVIAIAFELVLAVQSLVFLVAPVAGLLVGAYANQRAERWRPVGRVMANAAWAGLVTGISLAALYVLLRLIFVFADTGSLPDGTQMACTPGPDCTYQRYVRDGRADELAAAGITDGASFGAYAVREQLTGGLLIVTFTVAGALVAGGFRAVRAPKDEPTSAGSAAAA